MEITSLKLAGAYVVTLAPIRDARGYFVRAYDEKIFREHGLQTEWVQENQSLTLAKYTIRGLHFQTPPHSETKFIRVLEGAVLDVIVDLREDSETYGQWESVELSADNLRGAYVPKGFAHAFCSLTERALVGYKVDSAYSPDFEGSLRWNDPTVNISWPTDAPKLSEKDAKAALFEELGSPFTAGIR